MFAATFADAAWNVGYPDEDAAAAFAGGGDGGFAGGGDGAFVGGLGVCFTFDASRRLAAPTCSSLGGGAFSLGGGAGLLAALFSLCFSTLISVLVPVLMLLFRYPSAIFLLSTSSQPLCFQAEDGQMEVLWV